MPTSPYKATPDLIAFSRRMLEVSTHMVPKETADALLAQAGPLYDTLPYVPFHEYGWIIYISPEAAEDTPTHVEDVGHAALADLMRFAREHGFSYLKLDCDAEPLPGLPTFEW